MALSRDEKALMDATYERVRLWRKYKWGPWGAFIGVIPGMVFSTFETSNNPHASHHDVVISFGSFGLVIVMVIVSAFFMSRQRKRDGELVRFFERHFPDECSWKQEEKLLAEAEEIRLKAKADY